MQKTELNGYDRVISEIAEYAVAGPQPSEAAMTTAALSLADALGCAVLAGGVDRAMAVVDPAFRRDEAPGEIPVVGTRLRYPALRAAFANGALVRWLDYNDTFLALEWGHPSDSLGALLTAAWLADGERRPTVSDLCLAMISAHEIQGVLSMSTSLNERGYDHVAYVRVASSAAPARLLGAGLAETANAVSQAFVDGTTLRCYRHAPNAGERKSWAAGEATARGLELMLRSMGGEPGYPSAVTAPTWGFSDAYLGGAQLELSQPLGSYVMENVLFKVPHPAEFHAQSALEAAIALHPQVAGRLEEVERVEVSTQRSAIRIISKTGPLNNPADRDHSLEYIVAVGLIKGSLSHHDYEDEAAADPRIDALRARMQVVEDASFSSGYLDPAKRSVANAVTVHFSDGSSTETVLVEYPLGHPRRRGEAAAAVSAKLAANLERLPDVQERVLAVMAEPGRALSMGAREFLGLFLP